MKDSPKHEKKLVKSMEGQNEVDNAEVEIFNLDRPKVEEVCKAAEGLVVILKEGAWEKRLRKRKK